MIHPNVPCVLITPICPHSLSFRPIVVPAGVEIKVRPSVYGYDDEEEEFRVGVCGGGGDDDDSDDDI